MNTNEELAEIIERIDPESFCGDLGSYYRITHGRSGTQINVKECPRCGGTDWKVFLNADTGLGNCFHGSCADSPGFNLFSFAKASLQTDAKGAASYLREYSKRTGWVPTKKRVTIPRPTLADFTMPTTVSVRGSAAEPYLKNRGFDLGTVEKFGWSFCEKGVFAYKDFAGTPRTQDYSGRVIIPVRDINKKLSTFQGRDITGKSDQKYLFPPGLPGSGKFLYNADRAAGKPNAVMGEGVMDVAAIEMAFDGDDSVGAIGSFGKTFSGQIGFGEDDQLSRLLALKSKGLNRLVIMWDGEVSTIKRACDESKMIRSLGIDTYIARLPKDKDPNEVSAEIVRLCYFRAVQATPMNIAKIKLTLGK